MEPTTVRARYRCRLPHVPIVVRFAPVLAGVAIALVTLTGSPAKAGNLLDYLTGGSRALVDVEADIQRRFPGIEHMAPEKLDVRENAPPPLLVDVRRRDEYAVSRLSGATRIDPDASVSQIKDELGARVHGRQVVFYCSVGERSSRLAKRAKDHLMRAGAKGVHNLKGGIFAWHNLKRPLVDARGATPYVHPFSDRWGKLVARQSLIRYKPVENRTAK